MYCVFSQRLSSHEALRSPGKLHLNPWEAALEDLVIGLKWKCVRSWKENRGHHINQSEGFPRTGYFIPAHVGAGAGQIWASFRRRLPGQFLGTQKMWTQKMWTQKMWTQKVWTQKMWTQKMWTPNVRYLT